MRDNNYQELKTKASELGWVVMDYVTAGKEDEVTLRFRPKLTKNKYYSVWEPGMDEWLTMECIGYDKIRDQYIFTSQQDIEFFMYVHASDVNDEVKDMKKVTVSELDGEQYERIDNLADIRLVDSYIKSIKSLQIHLMSEGFEAKEIYEYLVTLMVNQC